SAPTPIAYTVIPVLDMLSPLPIFPLFSFTATPPPEIYTLSLHDALPIYEPRAVAKEHLIGPDRKRECSVCPEVMNASVRHECVIDRKSTRLNSSHLGISYAVFCLKKKKKKKKLYE